MRNRIFFGSAAIWLAAAGAWGQFMETDQPVRLELNPSQIVSTAFAPLPLRLPTALGSVTFLPGELKSIEFLPAGQCEVHTADGDRWRVAATPSILLPLLVESRLYGVWDRIQKVDFLSPTTAETRAAAVWKAELNDGSVLHLEPEQDVLRLETSAGKIDIPWGMVISLRVGSQDRLATVEMEPGGYAIQGFFKQPSFRAGDSGGRRLAVPWEFLERLTRVGRTSSPLSALVFSQEVSCQMREGPPSKVKVPVTLLTVSGRGGTWVLPTTRIMQVEKNSDGTVSVQTTVGEWLTGTIKPKVLPIADRLDGPPVPFSDCQWVKWANAPIEMPTNGLVWRLKTGDLVVGEWQVDPVAVPAASAVALRVRSPAAMPGARMPVPAEGQWPVSRFEIAHWAGGGSFRLSAAAVEAVGIGPVSKMPPALVPAGPSAIRSDEILMPGGTYPMGRTQGAGSADEVPPVDMSVESFWLANTPVTVAQFEAFVKDTKYVTDPERTPAAPSWRAPGFTQRADAPVVCVTWRDAVRYCNWRSAKAGLKPCYDISRDGQEVVFRPERNGYRLPLEAEWEYAARSGGQDVVYPWGDESDEETVAGLANFRGSDAGGDPWPWTNPVKAFPPSAAGFYDIVGNVWEWCQDIYREDAYAAAMRGEGLAGLLNAAPGRDERRVMRGGSYHNSLEFLRCATRGFGLERMNAPRVGFRVARNAETEAP